ncbi:catechol O-methyltransferase-like [Rhinophrynus dorsalis]
MLPVGIGVAWIIYKYSSRTLGENIVDLQTQRALCRYVLLESVHGQPDSVMQTFKDYAQQNHQIARMLFTPEQDLFLADVVKQAVPLMTLVLGTQCGYSAIHLLSLLPPNGKMFIVEQEENRAESAEEMILVAGFKNTQFKMLAQHPVDAIHVLNNKFGLGKVDLVLMDQQPSQYLPGLLALKEIKALRPGTFILANKVEDSAASNFLKNLQSDQSYKIVSSCNGLLKVECVES